MAIFLTSLISILFGMLETSFLPYFRIFGSVPFITLAFICLLSVKYRGFFHFFIALFCGMYFDYISGSYPGLFTAVFVTTAIVGRAFFYRDTGYDSGKSFFWLTFGSSTAIYVFSLIALFFIGPVDYLSFVTRYISGIVSTLIFSLFTYRIFDKYVDFLNKQNEEKYR